MAFVDDILEAEYRTGEIKLYGPEGFEGMRRAGRLAAECQVNLKRVIAADRRRQQQKD